MKKIVVLVFLLVFILCGCASSLPDGAQMQNQAAKTVENLAEAAEEITQGAVLADTKDGEEASDEAKAAAADDRTDEEKEDLSRNAYDYTQLSEEERLLYGIILDGLRENAMDVPIPETDEPVFEKVFQCVMNDHPEIFYVDGYTFIKYTRGDTLTGNAFSGSYIYDQEEIADRTRRIEKKVEGILAAMPAGGGEYERVKYVYEYLIANTEYVQGAEDNQNICSVFLNGRSVCQGYAKAAQYLLQQADVYTVFVSGQVESGEDHAWNLVRIDGDYYHLDTTWGDASYVISGSDTGYEGKLPEINYEYLCVPDNQLLKTHTISSAVPLPACDSMAANYYVREGAYFTEADMDKAAGLFEEAYADSTAYVTFKCADRQVYDEMRSHLIEQQEVFRYLHTSDGTVAYTTNEEQLALSFWL